MSRDRNGRNGEMKKKRTRKRKARTAGDLSSSDSDTEPKTTVVAEESSKRETAEESAVAAASPSRFEAENEVMEEAPKVAQINLDFSGWYLRQVAKEMEDDLDKIRSASDFKDSSLPILIKALQQGESVFSKEEKLAIVGSR